MFVEYANMESAPASGRAYYIFTDQIGTPVSVEDASQREVWRATYDPYGKCDLSPQNEIQLDLRFPGHYADPETGLHYNRRRYYSPTLGRYWPPTPSAWPAA